MSPPSIQSVFSEGRVFSPPPQDGTAPWIPNLETYRRLYRASLENPDQFWGKIAQDFFWFKNWEETRRYSFVDQIKVEWFREGKTNVAVNALDRHLGTLGSRPALIWEGNEPGETRTFSYSELHDEVGRLANALRFLGVKKGDRIALYMGMVPELAMGLLACARIGAIHNVIFGGFSAESLKERICDCGAKVLLTCDGLYRGNKSVNLKKAADEAMRQCAKEGLLIEHCLVLKRTGQPVSMQTGRDQWWHDVVDQQDSLCPPAEMDAEDPLFILYTSGSTGKPKGVLHSTAGYMVYVAATFKYAFDYHPGDLFWCTADIGWVTGHSYLVYGPLLNGGTTLMFEGVPTYPQNDRFWEIIDRHRVNIFYTAPTAIRALMKEGVEPVQRHHLSSLRLLGTVGEPINPEAWVWYYEIVGRNRCPIVDTWWQTETGGILITSFPGAMPLKPGSAGLPFFGVKPKILREDGSECEPDEGGYLVLEESWPAMLRTVYGQPDRVRQTYFSKFPGKYFTGDGARRDSDGYFWLLGRVDDVLNVSGHRLGTAELESAFVKHHSVTEAAVVGFPHPVKGQGIYAFLTLKQGEEPNRSLRRELVQHIAAEIGAIAKPDHILFTPSLPKTRSGKIMRRILRKIAAGEVENLGDTTTLADPSVVQGLVDQSNAESELKKNE